MLKLSSFLLFIVLAFSCQKDEYPKTILLDESTNKLLLLQLDFESFNFEGGFEFIFAEDSENLTLVKEEQGAGDFGWIKLYYEELDTLIFDGSIVWSGIGARNFPDELIETDAFSYLDTPLVKPVDSLFSVINEGEMAVFIDSTCTDEIWTAIHHLEIVENYRYTNPYGKINVLAYTSAIGTANPSEWEWYIFIRN